MVGEVVLTFIQNHPAPTYWLAYSGGLDSHVLLHACARLRQQYPDLNFQAIHIDHGLQVDSAAWAVHCQAVCAGLGMPMQVIRLGLHVPAGESLEAVARAARYRAFMDCMQAGDMLLSAHHQDDQAETLLLNLLRGSGVDGLAAMPACRVLGAGWLGRPLLALSRADLQAYATQHALSPITDPSNAREDFDRNYLRHAILPLLQGRWPVVTANLARAAAWQAESRDLQQHLLAAPMQAAKGGQPHTLSVRAVLQHDIPLQKALIRHWLHGLGFAMPSAKKLWHILHDVLQARADALPCVAWKGCEVRRYRDDVYAMPPLPAHDPAQVWAWQDLARPLLIPSLGLTLTAGQLGAWQDDLLANSQAVTVRFRQGGERLRRKDGHTVTLKQWMQEAGVPPWLRERIPLVYVGGELVVVGAGF